MVYTHFQSAGLRCRQILYGSLWLLCLIPFACFADGLDVLMVLSDNTAPYQAVATTLNKNLPASIKLTVVEHPEQLSLDASHADLIVAVGMKAAESAAAKTAIPLLVVMVPQMAYEDMLTQASPDKNTRLISAIYLDQPWTRQLDFLGATIPDRHKIGLLHSPSTHRDIARMRKDVAQRGGLLVAQPVRSTEGFFSSLESVMTSSDVLLAIPDSTIYSSSNIRNILLTSYRLGIPLIGLSQAYVNAGALCAIFSTPEQLAEQAGMTVISFEQTKRLPEPQFPVDFTIAVNQQVARALKIELLSPEDIRIRMGKAKEGSP